MTPAKKGMVFGVFDGLHEGHRHFLNSADLKAQTLVVVVAPDEATLLLKGRSPKHALSERMQSIQALNSRWVVVAGDSVQGEWSALKTYMPDEVFLGHDQNALAEELQKMAVPLSFIDAHRPKEFKSSLLNGGSGGKRTGDS